MERFLDFNVYSLPAVLLLGCTALILLVSPDWRVIIGALGFMYVGVFILVLYSWPPEMAVVKLVAGWISASVLGISMVSISRSHQPQIRYVPSEIIFRISAAGLIGLVTISLTPAVQAWSVNFSNDQVLGGLILLGMGILHLGFTSQPLHTIVGLLTFFAGFEILYAAVDSTVLVSGFLAVINMSVALVGAYLLLIPTMESEE